MTLLSNTLRHLCPEKCMSFQNSPKPRAAQRMLQVGQVSSHSLFFYPTLLRFSSHAFPEEIVNTWIILDCYLGRHIFDFNRTILGEKAFSTIDMIRGYNRILVMKGVFTIPIGFFKFSHQEQMLGSPWNNIFYLRPYESRLDLFRDFLKNIASVNSANIVSVTSKWLAGWLDDPRDQVQVHLEFLLRHLLPNIKCIGPKPSFPWHNMKIESAPQYLVI